MSQQADPPPITIAPPRPVLAAAVLVALEGLGLVVFAIVTIISGAAGNAAIGEMLAQAGYFVVLAVLLAAVGAAMLRGRRWGRTPAIVIQIIAVAIGFWLAVPSGQWPWGVALMLVAIVIGCLLLSPPANEWINRFPPMFGPEPDA